MRFLTLKGKTRYGKTRISRLGTEWELLYTQRDVVCLNGEEGMFIRPLSNPAEPRWIKTKNDFDFEIMGWYE